MRQHTMVSGTAVLAIAAIINRVVGLAFRPYLVRTFGQEVIGLYRNRSAAREDYAAIQRKE